MSISSSYQRQPRGNTNLPPIEADPPPVALSVAESLDALVANRHQARAACVAAVRHARQKLDFRPHKKDSICAFGESLPPLRRRTVGHQRHTVAMLDEPLYPREKAVSQAIRWVAPNKSAPRHLQSVLAFGVVL